MGGSDSKLHFRQAVVQLTTKSQPVEAADEAFWNQFWSESVAGIQEIFTLIPPAEIRALREELPSNLATLCYKAVEKIVQAADGACSTQREHQTVLNCVRLLTRLLPYMFEDPDWRGFFWSAFPSRPPPDADVDAHDGPEGSVLLAESLLSALADLLFCPDFSVTSNKKTGPESHEDMQTIDTVEYIWEAGVGFAHSQPHSAYHDCNRQELLLLLLTCFSETMYLSPPAADSPMQTNRWVAYFTSTDNRHALPLFTSLLNTICGYDPVGYGIPYNHLMFSDSRERLVETALHVLCVTLDNDPFAAQNVSSSDNLFVNYMSRIHRDEDFAFMLKGITRLLTNPLMQTYLPGSCKRIHFTQELLILFWKMCDINKKFMYFVLKSSSVLDVLVPILYQLNEARQDQSRVGLVHIGVFILLLLSGERNFGVRLNKPYTQRVGIDIPVFTGSHADLLIIVFHKIITTGHTRVQPLFDCLLTIIVNISPYLKSLSMVSSNKLLHLLEAFSTPWFLYANPSNHHLVFFLLEVFNNIIQYQFDGNANLIYTIIRKRNVVHQLANLPTEGAAIAKALDKKGIKAGEKNRSSSFTSTPASGRSGSRSTDDTGVSKRMPSPGGGASSENGAASNSGSGGSGVESGVATSGARAPSLAALPVLSKMTETHAPRLSEDSNGGGLSAAGSFDSPAADADALDADRPASAAGGSLPRVREARVQLPCSARSANFAEPPVDPLRPVDHLTSVAWTPTSDWVGSWKQKLPLQTILRLLQVLVPQVEKMCIDKGLTDESEILRFLQQGTMVGLLPVPHPILIRKYQPNAGTALWFRTYMWGVIYIRNVDPPIWCDTDVKLFEIQRL